jgi:D-3-phosphoglycerate dehydrogenase
MSMTPSITKHRVVIADALEERCITVLESEGFTVTYAPNRKPDELRALLREADALIVRSATTVTADLIDAAPQLKVIGRAGTGVDNIDVGAATRRGVAVMNTPGGNTVSTAEHTISMLLALARNIPQATISMRAGKWEKKKYTGTEVAEKTVGIIGLGKIGREVAVRCRGLGMSVIGSDPVLGSEIAARMGIELVTTDELFRRADFITVHTPLSDETRGLLNRESLARCKRGVRIINCARGGIVDEAALLEALESGHVEGAALDVFEVEPPADSPLVRHERVVVTPHLAASTGEAQEKVALQIARQVADALNGRGFAGVVNSAAVQTGVSADLLPFLELAVRMGSFVGQMLAGKLEGLGIVVSGTRAQGAMDLLRAGILQGLLGRLVPDPVNIISAPFLAREMGLAVSETKDPASDENTLRVRYTTGGVEREVAGTVFGSDSIRFIRLDGFRFDVRPEGHLLIYRNADRPGILARVGGILAAHGVNIAGVSLGRSAPGGEALTVMNLDGDIPPAAAAELRAVDAVQDLRHVFLM